MAHSVRMTKRSNELAEEIHSLTGKSKTTIVERALEVYWHQERMRLLNKSYEKYKSNKKSWEKELKEREELEGTIGDGVDE